MVSSIYADNDYGDNGAAYIFTYEDSSSKWEQTQLIYASDRSSNDNFGTSLAVFSDIVSGIGSVVHLLLFTSAYSGGRGISWRR